MDRQSDAKLEKTTEEYVELPTDAVDEALKELETAMRQSEMTLSHDEVRPSAHMTAMASKDAYRLLVEAHPDYDLVEDSE